MSRFILPTPLSSPVKTPPSLPYTSEKHSLPIGVVRSTPPGQADGAVSAPAHNELVFRAKWAKQGAKKIKDAFVTQRTVSVKNRRRRKQAYRNVHSSLAAFQGIGKSISLAQENASTILKLPSADVVLQEVYEHVPYLSELQQRVQAEAGKLCADAWKSYEKALEESPMQAKALTSGFGLTLADLIAQMAEGAGWDVMRTTKMASFGLLWHGVSGHAWYQFLDSNVMPQKASSTHAIVAKMVLDQAIWAPLNTALFYAYIAMADGRLASLPDTLQAKLLPTILAGYFLWPAAHLIGFKWIPSSQRLLYINVVNLFWTVYLSGMANSSPTVDPVQGQVQKFGLAIPVSNQPVPVVPNVVQPAPPSVVQV